MRAARAALEKKRVEASSARAQRTNRALRASIGYLADCSHCAHAMGLDHKQCFDPEDQSTWSFNPCKHGASDEAAPPIRKTCMRSDGARADAQQESSDESSSTDGSMPPSNDDESDSEAEGSAAIATESSTNIVARSYMTHRGVLQAALCLSSRAHHTIIPPLSCPHAPPLICSRAANNVICRLAVYCGWVADESRASVGKLNQMLIHIFKKLPRETVSHFAAKEVRVHSVVFERVKAAIQMMKHRLGFNAKGFKGGGFTEADRHTYHVLLCAVAPPKPPEGAKNALFRRVCRALGIHERQSTVERKR